MVHGLAQKLPVRPPALLVVPLTAALCGLISRLDGPSAARFSFAILALQTIGLRILGEFGQQYRSLARNIFGTVLGIVIFSVAQQLWLRATNQSVHMIVLLTIGVLAAVTPGRVSLTRDFGAIGVEDARTWLAGVSSALLVWSQTHFWPATWAVATILVIVLTHNPQKPKVWMMAFVSLIAFAGFITQRTRSTNWPVFAEEHVFYELLSTSLALRPTDSPLFTTTSGITYHWISYSFSGWLTLATGATEFVMTAGVLPVFFAILALALLLDRLSSASLGVGTTVLLVGCIGFFGSRMGEGNMHGVVLGLAAPSFSLATCVVCCLFLTVDRIHRNPNLRGTLVGMLFSFAAIGSYMAVGLIPVGAAILYLATASLRTDDKSARRRLILASSALTSAVAAALRVFAGFPNSAESTTAWLAVLPLFRFVEELTGEIFVLDGLLRSIAKFGYFSGIIAPVVLLAIRPKEQESSGFSQLTRTCSLLSIAGLVAVQDDSYASSRVLVTSLYFFAIPFLFVGLVRSRHLRSTVLNSSVLGFAVWLVWLVEDDRRAPLGGPTNVMFRALGQAAPAVVGLVGGTAAFIGWIRSRKSATDTESIGENGASRAWLSAAVAVLVFGSLQGVSTSVEAWRMYQPRFEDWGVSYSSNDDTERSAQYLRSNSDSSAIIAIDTADSGLQLQHFVRLSQRQVLVIGASLWAKRFYEDSDAPLLLQLQRQLSSPTPELFSQLKTAGVTHIVLRREISRQRFLSLVGHPDYENASWAIYIIAPAGG